MDRLPFLFTAAMKRLIAMAGRKIIRQMGDVACYFIIATPQ
jgi:hypothetical protein